MKDEGVGRSRTRDNDYEGDDMASLGKLYNPKNTIKVRNKSNVLEFRCC